MDTRRRRILVTMLGGGGGAASELNALLDKFAPSGDYSDLSISRSVDTYVMRYPVSADHYAALSLVRVTGDRTDNHSIRRIDIDIPIEVKDDTFTGVSRVGAGWSGPLSGAGYGIPGDDYYRSLNAGDYLQFVSPANTTAIGMVGFIGGNAGISKIEIDGDATAANECKTAAEIVALGWAASTILVANGGTLNPTDRVVDWYQDGNPARRVLASGLTPGIHTLKVTNTGYKNPLSSGVRLYASGVLYRTTSTRSNTSGVEWKTMYTPFSGDSVIEFAFNTQINGVQEWTGNGHGNDQETSFTISVDGTPVTLTSGQSATATTSIVVVKETSFVHAQTAPAAFGSGTITYTLSASGVNVLCDLDWTQTVQSMSGFIPMLPVVDALDVGSMVGATQDYNVGGDPGTDSLAYGNLATDTVYIWDGDGRAAVLLHATNNLAATNNWQYGADKVFLQDRSDGLLNKFYFSWNKTMTNGENWVAEFYLRVAWLSSASVLAR